MLVQSQSLLQKVIQGCKLEEYEQIMIRKFFKAITYFLKFVIKSRLLHVQVRSFLITLFIYCLTLNSS